MVVRIDSGKPVYALQVVEDEYSFRFGWDDSCIGISKVREEERVPKAFYIFQNGSGVGLDLLVLLI